MCRLTAVLCSDSNPILLADILTRPRMSIIRQSFYCQKRLQNPDPRWAYEVSNLNGDGFGVGWYIGKKNKLHHTIIELDCPCVLTSLKPAWSDRNLVNIAEKTISHLVFAHVRAAGPGSGWSSEMNCHPFQFGKYLFMHNGTIGEWIRVRRQFISLLSPAAFDYVMSAGFIDSVSIFALIISQLTRGPYGNYVTNELRVIVERTIGVIEQICQEEKIAEPSFLNIVLTDGECIICARHVVSPFGKESNLLQAASLYFATGTKWARDNAYQDIYRMIQIAKKNDITIITSEPLTDNDHEWVPVPNNHILIVTPGIDVLLYPVPNKQDVLTDLLIDAGYSIPYIKKRTSDRIQSGNDLSHTNELINRPISWIPHLKCFSNFYQGTFNKQLSGSIPIPGFYAPSLPPFLGKQHTSLLLSSDELSMQCRVSSSDVSEDKSEDLTILKCLTTDNIIQHTDNQSNPFCVEDTLSINNDLKPLDFPIQTISQSLEALSHQISPFYHKSNTLPCQLTETEYLNMNIPSNTGLSDFDMHTTSFTSFSNFSQLKHNGLKNQILSECDIPPTNNSFYKMNKESHVHYTIINRSCGRSVNFIFKLHEYDIIIVVSPCSHFIMGNNCAVLSFTWFSLWEEPRVSVTQHPKTYIILGSQDGTVSIWDIFTGEQIEIIIASQEGILCLLPVFIKGVECSIQSQLLLFVGSSDTTITVWDLSYLLQTQYNRTHTKIKQKSCCCLKLCVEPYQGDVLSLVLHSSCNTHVIEQAFLYIGFQTTLLGCLSFQDIFYYINASHHDTVIISVSNDTSFSLTIKNPTLYPTIACSTFPKHCGFVECLISSYPYIFSAGGDGLIIVWKSNKPQHTLIGHRGGILCLTITQAPDWTLYSGSRDRTIRVWDIELLLCRHTLKGHQSDVLSLAVERDYLLSGSAIGEVFCWCRQTHTLLRHLSLGPQSTCIPITSICILPRSQELIIPQQTDQYHPVLQCVSSIPIASTLSLQIGSNISTPSTWYLHQPFSQNDVMIDPLLLSSNIQTLSTPYNESNNFVIEDTFKQYNRHVGPYTILASGADGVVRYWSLTLPISFFSKNNFMHLHHDIDQKEECQNNFKLFNNCRQVKQLLPLNSSLLLHHKKCHYFESLEELLRQFIAIPSVSGRLNHTNDCWKAAQFVSSCLESVGAKVHLVDTGSGYNPLVVARLGNTTEQSAVLFYSHYDVVPALSTLPHHCSVMSLFSSFSETFNKSPPIQCLQPASYSIQKQHTGQWNTDPWTLTRLNDYYYGRGVTDNKGPLLAQIFSVLNIPNQHNCHPYSNINYPPLNVIWISEGEEENGSHGFEDSILHLKQHSKLLDNVLCIVCTNSYWVGDTHPCIVAGMRGVIDLTITIQGGSEPIGHHSGFHGGAIVEPLLDLIFIIGLLVENDGTILIPGFYDDVDPSLIIDDSVLLDEALTNLESYKRQVKYAGLRNGAPLEILKKRWLTPVLSVTEIWSSTQESQLSELGQTFRVIPSRAHCNISIRCVANQNLNKIITHFETYVKKLFETRHSPNTLNIVVVHISDWWTGNIESKQFRAAVESIKTVWGKDPLIVREGGTMPVIRFLQETFNVPAVHIPIGQASDAAHLPNERLRMSNLHKGLHVLHEFLLNLSKVQEKIT